MGSTCGPRVFQPNLETKSLRDVSMLMRLLLAYGTHASGASWNLLLPQKHPALPLERTPVNTSDTWSESKVPKSPSSPTPRYSLSVSRNKMEQNSLTHPSVSTNAVRSKPDLTHGASSSLLWCLTNAYICVWQKQKLTHSKLWRRRTGPLWVKERRDYSKIPTSTTLLPLESLELGLESGP